MCVSLESCICLQNGSRKSKKKNKWPYNFLSPVLESLKSRHTEPIARKIEVLQRLVVQHIFEVETVLLLDSIVRDGELLELRSAHRSDKLMEVVNDRHADQLE